MPKEKTETKGATKAGKQNARYSDDIRKVVAKYRAEGINMKKLDYYQNVLDKSVFPFIDIGGKLGMKPSLKNSPKIIHGKTR